MVLEIIRADIFYKLRYIFSNPPRGEKKCKQRVKCPHVLSVKPSNNGIYYSTEILIFIKASVSLNRDTKV